MGEIISIETLRLWQEQEKENKELQERIKKAIEYIDKMYFEISYKTCLRIRLKDTQQGKELLNILKGE